MEFDLSEKIVYWRDKGFIPANSIHIEDVKEFIKRLKKELAKYYEIVNPSYDEIIDRLAGEHLV